MMAASTSSFSAAVMVTSAARSGFLQISQQGMVAANGLVLRHIAAGLAEKPHRGFVHGLAQAGT